MKKCTKCGVEKEEGEFHNNKGRKDGLNSRCKACVKEYQNANKERIAVYNREYYEANIERLKADHIEYYKENKEEALTYRAEYYKSNREKFLSYHKEYYKENKEKLSAYAAKRHKNRYKTDALWADTRRLRCLTGNSFRRGGFTKRSKTFKLVGCAMEELLDKWGVDKIQTGYEIDHIVPLAQAKTIEEVEKLCHWKNLALLTAEDNQDKSDKKTEENSALCLELLGREWID
jgi:hypothetical protein